VLERPHITNLLLLTVLTGILLVSGSLQCAFDCLTHLDNGYRPSVRVDVCHSVNHPKAVIAGCPSKACHQGEPYHSNLGSPEYHNQQLQNHPLASFSPGGTPQAKSGDPFERGYPNLPGLLAFQNDLFLPPFQSQNELRTTVLLN